MMGEGIMHKNKQQKTYTKIKNKLMGAYCIPVILIIILGIASYSMASKVVLDKYKSSVKSTMIATEKYLDVITSSVQTKAASIITEPQLLNYYNNLYIRTNDSEVQKTFNTIYNSTANYVLTNSFLSDIYVLVDHGKPLLSYKKTEAQLRKCTEDNFVGFWDSEEAVHFKDEKVKGKWIGCHPFIDEHYFGDSSAYAFSYIRIFEKRDGVVAIDIDNKLLHDTITSMDIGDGSIIGLVLPGEKEVLMKQTMNKDGELISENITEEAIIFETEAILKASGEDNEAIYSEEIKFEGEKYYYYKLPIGTTGLNLSALVPISNITSQISKIRIVSVIIVILGAVLALGIGTTISYGISNVLKKVCISLRKVADGDLSQEFTTNRKDELKILTDTLNETISGIRALMHEVRAFSADVNSSSNQVADSSDVICNTMKEVSIALDEVAGGIESQAGDTETCASQMGNFSSKMDIVSTNANKINNTVDKTLECTEHGRATMIDLNQKASATTEIVRQLVDDIHGVVSHSQDISGIIDTINQIAEQTNLLSLNASIEAARAGEQGRGFAVVAEEIRKLADQSMRAGDQIYSILDKVNSSTKSAFASAEKTNVFLANQGEVLSETTQVFGDISKCVDEMVAGLNDIMLNIKGMIMDKDVVASSISNIAAVSAEVAVSTRNVTDSISEELDIVVELANQAKILNEKAKSLNESMKHIIVEA